MNYSCIKTNDHITVVNSDTGESGTVNADHNAYQTAVDAVRAGDFDTFMLIANPATIIHKFADNRIVIDGGVVTFDGNVLHGVLADRMVDSIQEGFGVEPLANFLINLNDNPSHRAVSELYGFLEETNLTITKDGYFVAYKKIGENYMDCYTGTMDNSPGSVVEMERNKVDDDKDRTCSKGLHFCGRAYLSSYGGARTVVVKINPRDVVSIPSDYNNHKGRCCKYEVIGELDNGRTDTGERTEQELEGSVFTGEGMDMHEDHLNEEHDTLSGMVGVIEFLETLEDELEAEADTGVWFYSSRSDARDFARGRADIKFHDFGIDAPEGQRWATIPA